MAVPYKIVEMPTNKIDLKCPYPMSKPIGITVHNTANSAPAKNEIAYMQRNNMSVSFHIAVDDIEAIQGISLDRNAWHSGDGNGDGNRKTISIEICYSTDYQTDRYEKAEENAVQLIAKLLKKRGWTVENNLFKHQDWNGKNCPHRILDEGRWESFKNRIKEAMDEDYKGWFYDNGWKYEKADKTIYTNTWQLLKWSKGENWFYFDENGYAVKGWHKLKWSKGENWFYFGDNCEMLQGWQLLDWSGGRNWFYFDRNGAMTEGVHELEWKGVKSLYAFDSNGVLIQGGKGSTTVIANPDGTLVTEKGQL